jgi:hypothetical protein
MPSVIGRSGVRDAGKFLNEEVQSIGLKFWRQQGTIDLKVALYKVEGLAHFEQRNVMPMPD